jgi:hypothetical protein
MVSARDGIDGFPRASGDPDNEAHDLIMGVLFARRFGGTSTSESGDRRRRRPIATP